MERSGRNIGFVALAALATLIVLYWRSIVFVTMVLLYTAWHRLFG
ncbi:hypothetical protein [Bradyrhizobium diversitatis]|nr:hypothetical protein [Bradyrhizobium diversitatis]